MSDNKFYTVATKTFREGNHKELWEKAQAEGYEAISVFVKSNFTKSSDGKKYKVTLSTSDLDRHGDVVRQSFVHDDILPFIDSHQYGSIFHILGSVSGIEQGRKKTTGYIKFSTYRDSGREAEQMAENGDLRKVSIGFIPLKFNSKGEIVEAELLELSGCSVSANNWAEFEKTAKEVAQDEGKTEDEIPEETPEIEKVEVEAPETENGSAEPDSDSPTPPEGVEVDQNSGNTDTVTVGEGIYKAVIALRKDQQKQMMMIAEGLKKSNPHEQKRKVYKAIREALKSR